MVNTYVNRAEQLASLLAVLVLWLVLTTAAGIVPTLPSPPEVFAAFVDAVAGSTYWEAVARSTFRVYFSFVLAAVIAVPLGLLIGRNEVIGDLTFPALEVLRPIPPIAWFPALTVILFTAANIVRFIIFLAAFFPILLNTIEGVRGIEEEYSQAAQSLGASSRQTLRHVILPGALPSIHTGLVNAMGLTWVSLVAAEILSNTGLGYYIWIAFAAGAYANIIVGMITIGILGYASSVLVRQLGARQLQWV
jgi:NitT/TauT family transport system permease protein